MFKRPFLICVMLIGMTFVWVGQSDAVYCSRCRTLEGICLEQIYERIKETWKNQQTAKFTLEAKTAAFTDWCNPSGQCNSSWDIGDYNPFFAVNFGTSSFDVIGLDDLVKGKLILAKDKVFMCELRDKWLCPEDSETVTRTYSEVGEDGVIRTYEVQVCLDPLDLDKIPPEAYWDTGQVGNWTPQELWCPDPWVYTATSEDDAGGLLIGTLWVQTYIVPSVCDKDGVCVPGEEVPGEAGCFRLNTDPANPDDWDYEFDPVSEEYCY